MPSPEFWYTPHRDLTQGEDGDSREKNQEWEERSSLPFRTVLMRERTIRFPNRHVVGHLHLARSLLARFYPVGS